MMNDPMEDRMPSHDEFWREMKRKAVEHEQYLRERFGDEFAEEMAERGLLVRDPGPAGDPAAGIVLDEEIEDDDSSRPMSDDRGLDDGMLLPESKRVIAAARLFQEELPPHLAARFHRLFVRLVGMVEAEFWMEPNFGYDEGPPPAGTFAWDVESYLLRLPDLLLSDYQVYEDYRDHDEFYRGECEDAGDPNYLPDLDDGPA
jgi:hypothetical protein